MKLSRIVYVSDAVNTMTSSDLSALVGKCRDRNTQRGITGLLLSSSGHFIQVLEGDPMRIESLYSKIAEDARHKEVTRLSFKAIEQRLFPQWGMELVDANLQAKLDREQINKMLLRIRLIPGSAADEALTLLQTFRDQLQAKVA